MTKEEILARVPQVVGIAIYCLFGYMIIAKGYEDISWIADNYPGAFWWHLASYFLHNVGG